MSEGQNPATVLLAVIFGALSGMILLVLLAWQAGFLDWDGNGRARSGLLSATPGMDSLNSYQCRKGETKHIIMGGIEDNFALDNVETRSDSPTRDYFAKRLGSISATDRNYDERGLDRSLFDDFKLPLSTAHGIIVMRLEELSTLKNDSVSIGHLNNNNRQEYGMGISSLETSNVWKSQQGVIKAKLSDLELFMTGNISNEPTNETQSSALDLIQMGETITVRVSDDTMVDFIGFAACAAPTENKGSAYLINEFAVPDGLISLSCHDGDDNVLCNPYKGVTLCDTKLPLACFHDTQAPLPDALKQYIYAMSWSGGEVQFTAPIAGDFFETEDHVHQFCAAEFGDKWRALTTHDGTAASRIVAKAQTPSFKKVWVDTKTQIYGNCWKLRPDFDDIDQKAD